MVHDRPQGGSAVMPSDAVRRRERFRELDGLRGIASMAVVLMHLTYLFDEYYPMKKPLPFQVPWGGYGVQLFFLVSGFVILMTVRGSERPRDFLISRLTRLYPTYWAAVLLTAAFVNITRVPGLPRTPFEIVLNLTMIQQFLRVRHVDGAYWSLSIELFFYGLILITMMLAKRLTDRVVDIFALSWLTWSVLAVGASAFTGSKVISLVSVGTGAPFAGLFVCGMYCYLSRRSGRLRWQLLPSSVIASALGALDGVPTDFWIYAGIIAAFVVVTRLPRIPLLTMRPLLWLGAISYPLYLLHQSIGYAIQRLLTNEIGRPAAFAVALLAVMSLAQLVHVLVEEKASRWLRRALQRRFAA